MTTPIEIKLPKGYVATVDKRDFDMFFVGWSVLVSGGRAYVIGRLPNGRAYMHRAIAERIIGRPLAKGEVVDHLDNNPLNNTRSNLRVCTQKQNRGNSKKCKNNKSGYKGVTRHRSGWVAMISREYLGLFKTPEAAHEAYCKAATRIYGEFARYE